MEWLSLPQLRTELQLSVIHCSRCWEKSTEQRPLPSRSSHCAVGTQPQTNQNHWAPVPASVFAVLYTVPGMLFLWTASPPLLKYHRGGFKICPQILWHDSQQEWNLIPVPFNMGQPKWLPVIDNMTPEAGLEKAIPLPPGSLSDACLWNPATMLCGSQVPHGKVMCRCSSLSPNESPAGN